MVTVVAYNGDNEEFTRISETWRKAESPEERKRNLFAVAEIRHAESVERTLYLALGDAVKSQDAPGLLANLLSHPYSQQLAWKFVGEHRAEFEQKVSQRRLPHLIEACSSFSRRGQLEALKAFVAAHPLPSGRRAAAKTLELAAINTRFRTRAQGLPDVFARAEQ